jgi:hypothetical protein
LIFKQNSFSTGKTAVINALAKECGFAISGRLRFSYQLTQSIGKEWTNPVNLEWLSPTGSFCVELLSELIEKTEDKKKDYVSRISQFKQFIRGATG